MGISEWNIYLSLFMSNESLCNSGSRVRREEMLGVRAFQIPGMAGIKRAN